MGGGHWSPKIVFAADQNYWIVAVQKWREKLEKRQTD